MKRLALLLLLTAACGGGGTVAVQLAPLTIVAPLVANDARPTIVWTPLNFATTYRVSVWADAARTQLIERRDVTTTAIQMTTALADGQEAWVDVAAAGRTGSSRFRVLLLPESFPEFVLRRFGTGRHQGGYKLFNLLDISPPAGVDRVGAMVLVNALAEVVWFYVHPTRGILTDPRVLENGNITFIVRDNDDAANVTSPGFEIDWDGNIVWQSRPGALLHHELTPGPDGQRLYMTFLSEEVNGKSYESDGLELVDPATNEVLWSFSLFDHFRPDDPDLPDADNIGLSRLGVDWSHANSAAWDPARSLVWMSIRHFDRIIGIDYPSGAIRVTVGVDGLGPPGYMSHQHAPEVQADGSILFWDNGNATGMSKAKMFELDELAGTITPVFEWTDDPPIFDFAVGDADRQPNGNFLITAGISGRVIEVDPDGRIVWELALITDRHWIYRSQQVPEELIPPDLMR